MAWSLCSVPWWCPRTGCSSFWWRFAAAILHHCPVLGRRPPRVCGDALDQPAGGGRRVGLCSPCLSFFGVVRSLPVRHPLCVGGCREWPRWRQLLPVFRRPAAPYVVCDVTQYGGRPALLRRAAGPPPRSAGAPNNAHVTLCLPTYGSHGVRPGSRLAGRRRGGHCGGAWTGPPRRRSEACAASAP